jgi:hypothetical protein
MLGLILAVALILVLGFRFIHQASFMIAAVRYPFGLDYGEGIVWQQAMLIPGPRMYGDITRFPFIVFHYPPAYHLAVRAVSDLGVDWLATGRAISVISSFAGCGVLAAMAWSGLREITCPAAALLGAAVAGLVIVTCGPFVTFSPLMRVDMLAIALDLAGLWCVLASIERPFLSYVGFALFVLAVFTKQTSVAAPLAASVLLLTRPRQAVKATGFGIALGLVPLVILTWMTHGGFERHILLYNINRYSLHRLLYNLYRWDLPYIIYFVLAVASVCVGWRYVFRTAAPSVAALRYQVIVSRFARLLTLVTAYFCLCTLTLILYGKSGAGPNYMIEWMFAWSILVGLLAGIAANGLMTQGRSNGPSVQPVPALVILFLVLQAALLARTAHLPNDTVRAGLAELVRKVQAADKPVISDDMVVLMRAGKEVVWEPAIFAELATMKVWDEQPFLDMIKQHDFSFIIKTGTAMDASRFTPAVTSAIEAYYPRIEKIAGTTVHLPPDQPR